MGGSDQGRKRGKNEWVLAGCVSRAQKVEAEGQGRVPSQIKGCPLKCSGKDAVGQERSGPQGAAGRDSPPWAPQQAGAWRERVQGSGCTQSTAERGGRVR